MWPWARHLCSLSLSFFICKIRILIHTLLVFQVFCKLSNLNTPIIIMLVNLSWDMIAEVFGLTLLACSRLREYGIKRLYPQKWLHPTLSSPFTTTKLSGNEKFCTVKNKSCWVFDIYMFNLILKNWLYLCCLYKDWDLFFLPSFFPFFLFFVCLFVLFFRAAPTAYGSSQTWGRIRAAAAGLKHSHNNAGSELHLQPTPLLRATLDP